MTQASERPKNVMSKAAIDRAEADALAKTPVKLRPRDAATLILLRRDGGVPRVLLGRRHRAHAFMPGKFVFPGGRRDPSDGRVDVAHPLPAADQDKLIAGMGARASARRAQSLALSAVRETYEEAGLFIGTAGRFETHHPDWQAFSQAGIVPDLSRLRYVARAITPPGRVRRFDTRFFAAFEDCVAHRLPDGGPTGELEELCWLSFAEARKIDIPVITHRVLDDLEQRLDSDACLAAYNVPVPQYRLRGKSFVREMI